jgi:hypothetical protein
MQIITKSITVGEAKEMAEATFGNLVKAVVDVERELIAIGGKSHHDLEQLLLKDGSKQKDLWGINIYPDIEGDDFIEFDFKMNLRPAQGNKTRTIRNFEEWREIIISIVDRRIKQ